MNFGHLFFLKRELLLYFQYAFQWFTAVEDLLYDLEDKLFPSL
jgi:hypothetical protein